MPSKKHSGVVRGKKPYSLSWYVLQHPNTPPSVLANMLEMPNVKRQLKTLRSALKKQGHPIAPIEKSAGVNRQSPLVQFVLENLSMSPSEVAERFNRIHPTPVTPTQVSQIRSRLNEEGLEVQFTRTRRTGGFSIIDPITGEPKTRSDRLRKALLRNQNASEAALMKQLNVSKPLIQKIKRQLIAEGLLSRSKRGRKRGSANKR